jgi:peptidoglycan LD-endopeptidase CwlK
MIASRSIAELEPETRARATEFLEACHAAGIDVLVTSTYRDFESQAELFAQGRTKPGKRVTNARPGLSWHNWRRAFDIVPLRNGKPVWGNGIDDDPTDDDKDDLELWQRVGKLGKEAGLEWAGDWVSFREFPHFQFTDGHTLHALLDVHPKGLDA